MLFLFFLYILQKKHGLNSEGKSRRRHAVPCHRGRLEMFSLPDMADAAGAPA